MNSYFLAMQQATSNFRFPELSDLWRTFHPSACMLDSDYCIDDSCRFEPMTTKEEEATTGQKRLYVPVTRKVILTDEKNQQKLHSGMIQK